MGTLKTAFTVAEAHQITGLQPKMIDYLCRQGLVVPSASKSKGRGRGRIREFTFADVLLLQILKKLLDQGISVSRLKTSIKKVRGQFANVPQTGPLIERYIFTDGRNAYFRAQDKIIELIGHPGQQVFSFIVDVEETRNQVLAVSASMTHVKTVSAPPAARSG
ncbi:MAG: hypothetical protein C0454_08555 [Parvibaculum sp.]|nr:hypothetical protein [Parvibaculum sp.]